MTVAQEYMRKSTLKKFYGNRLPEFLETPCSKPANGRPEERLQSRGVFPALTVCVVCAIGIFPSALYKTMLHSSRGEMRVMNGLPLRSKALESETLAFVRAQCWPRPLGSVRLAMFPSVGEPPTARVIGKEVIRILNRANRDLAALHRKRTEILEIIKAVGFAGAAAYGGLRRFYDKDGGSPGNNFLEPADDIEVGILRQVPLAKYRLECTNPIVGSPRGFYEPCCRRIQSTRPGRNVTVSALDRVRYGSSSTRPLHSAHVEAP